MDPRTESGMTADYVYALLYIPYVFYLDGFLSPPLLTRLPLGVFVIDKGVWLLVAKNMRISIVSQQLC